MKDIYFLYIDKTEYEKRQKLFLIIDIKSIRNTMKLHYVSLDSTKQGIFKKR